MWNIYKQPSWILVIKIRSLSGIAHVATQVHGIYAGPAGSGDLSKEAISPLGLLNQWKILDED